jgi:hypothetical protein
LVSSASGLKVIASVTRVILEKSMQPFEKFAGLSKVFDFSKVPDLNRELVQRSEFLVCRVEGETN